MSAGRLTIHRILRIDTVNDLPNIDKSPNIRRKLRGNPTKHEL